MNGNCTEFLSNAGHPFPVNQRAYQRFVENRLLHILRQNPGCHFLEIGIGRSFRQERFNTIDELRINYVGLDFEHVCAERRTRLSAAGIVNRNIRFWGNYLGTYLFNLVRLARHYESFDIIYLDGDHSLYVDFAAAIAAVRLLKPGGLFLFGDVRFAFGSRELAQPTKQLTEDEANEPHVPIIIREYLIPLFNFEVEKSLSDPDWIALRAPTSAPWMRL